MISYLTGSVLGNVRAGFMADAVGVPAAIWIGRCICLLGMVATGLALPRFWNDRSINADAPAVERNLLVACRRSPRTLLPYTLHRPGVTLTADGNQTDGGGFEDVDG